MAEDILIDKNANKADKYETIRTYASVLTDGEPDLIANLSNLAALLHSCFNWHWTGFYLVKTKHVDSRFGKSDVHEDLDRIANDSRELVLGPFQGPVACTRIAFGKGVCGTAWKEEQDLLVPDVDKFPGHIACSSLSVAEIVIPMRNLSGDIVAVLDIDASEFNILDETDLENLSLLANSIRSIWGNN